MDLHYVAVHDVVHPTAIFHSSNQQEDHLLAETLTDAFETPSWENSQLNPKNRIDSLDPPKSPLWRIDGCAGLGTQFYAVPTFIKDVPPLRFDVYVSEQAVESPLIRELLDMNQVFHMRDHTRIQRTGIYSYVLRALELWTRKYGQDRVRDLYFDQPFGTRIMLANLPLNVRDVEIHIVQMHNIESHHLSLRELSEIWSMDSGSMPQTVDIFNLAFVKQLHDSVCLVRHRKDHESGASYAGCQEDELWVLKALTSGVKYMYHELRVLLMMPPHPNVIARPTRLVTKKSQWNKKKTLIVGFMVPYYSGGGLRDELPLLRMNHMLKLEDQARWAKQICNGLLHVRNEAKTYYPDLRLDQIVLSSVDHRIVILDFEQRGVWCEFGPPEVNALEYTRLLALDDEADAIKEARKCSSPDSPFCGPNEPYARILNRLLPGWEELCVNEDHYKNPQNGYNIPWLCLSPREQEYAGVYMLGRLLWCIFEGMSAPQRGAIWQSYRNEPEFDFPEFRRTPLKLRSLIDRCTNGRRDQLSNYVVRKGSQMVLRNDPRGDGTTEEIRTVASEFWRKEVAWAEGFLLDREKKMAEGTWDDNFFNRPTLDEVDSVLKEFQEDILRGTDATP